MKSFTAVFLVVVALVLVKHCREAALERAQSATLEIEPAVSRPVPVLCSVPETRSEFDCDLDEPQREAAEGLPVPIYPGTRVTQAEIRPPQPPGSGLPRKPTTDEKTSASPPRDRDDARTVSGQLCATELRARANARVHLEREVTDWLAPDVPAAWKPPAYLIDRLIRRTRIEPVIREYGTLYEATLHVDLSPARRAGIVEAYHRDLVRRRMLTLGGGLGFVLACLAALAGYIRADEATKGYYTPWLRAAATAGVGAAGVLTYQWLV